MSSPIQPWHIRRALLSDVDALFPMLEKLCAMHKALEPARYDFLPHLRSLYDPWLKKIIVNPRHLVLVAETTDTQSSQLVGFLLSSVEEEIPIYHVKEYGFIHDLWVEQDYRKHGMGRQLVEGAIAHYRQHNIPQVRLSTILDNEGARQLYASCGFRISTIDMLIELSS